MPRSEDEHRGQRRREGFPQHRRLERRGLELPEELKAALRDPEYACLMDATNLGTAFIIKAPGREIESVRGTVPILLRHEVFDHPSAPVVRGVLHIYDEPERPLALETFTNVADPLQRVDLARLATQDLAYLFFYDERLLPRLTKAVPLAEPQLINQVLAVADLLLLQIPRDRFDFNRAKAEVQRRNPL